MSRGIYSRRLMVYGPKEADDETQEAAVREIDKFVDDARAAMLDCSPEERVRISMLSRMLIQPDKSQDPKRMRIAFFDVALVCGSEDAGEAQQMIHRMLTPTEDEVELIGPKRIVAMTPVNKAEMFNLAMQWKEPDAGPMLSARMHMIDRNILLEEYPLWPPAIQAALDLALVGAHPSVLSRETLINVEETLGELKSQEGFAIYPPHFVLNVTKI